MKNVVAVVVTYNRCSLLLECVNALLKSLVPVDILIVDNASTDGTKDRISEYVDDEKIFYVNTGKNLGGAGGFNFGLRKACEMGYDFFWLMDDDTIVKKDSLSNILKIASAVNQNFGFISSLARWIDGNACVMNHHFIANDWGKDKLLLQEGALKIDVATFVSFFTKRNVVEKVGLPLKEYFIWGDDTEYSLRISRLYPSYLAFQSEVIHKMKENQNTAHFADITDLQRIQRMSYAFRNGCCTNKRLGKKKLLRYTLHCVRELFDVMKRAKSYKIKKLVSIVFNYTKGLLFFNPKIEFYK